MKSFVKYRPDKILYAILVCASLLIVMLCQCMATDDAYEKDVERKESMKGEIRELSDFAVSIAPKEMSFTATELTADSLGAFALNETDPKRDGIKDGQLLHVSGKIVTTDSIVAMVRSGEFFREDTVLHNVLYAYYHEDRRERKSGDKYVFKPKFENCCTAENVTICGIPLDTSLIREMAEDVMENVASVERGEVTERLDVMPECGISCIVMMKDGRLTKMYADKPFHYSTDMNASVDDLLEGYVLWSEMMNGVAEGLTVMLAVCLIVLLGVRVFKRRKKKSSHSERYEIVDTQLRSEITKVNRMRYALLAGCVMWVPLMYCVPCLISGTWWVNPNVLLFAYFIISAVTVFVSMIFANIYLRRYYKKHIVDLIVAKQRGVITKVEDEPYLNIWSLHELGAIDNLQGIGFLEGYLGTWISGDDNYVHNEEDYYKLRVFNAASGAYIEIKFLETTVKKIRKVYARKYSKSLEDGVDRVEIKELFNALCMEIPMDCDETLRLNIVPSGIVDYSTLDRLEEKEMRWDGVPKGYKVYVGENREAAERLLDDTQLLDNLNMIISTLKACLEEEKVWFYLAKGTLFVLVITDKDRFDVSIEATVEAGDAKRDTSTFEALCEIGKNWKVKGSKRIR